MPQTIIPQSFCCRLNLVCVNPLLINEHQLLCLSKLKRFSSLKKHNFQSKFFSIHLVTISSLDLFCFLVSPHLEETFRYLHPISERWRRTVLVETSRLHSTLTLVELTFCPLLDNFNNYIFYFIWMHFNLKLHKAYK